MRGSPESGTSVGRIIRLICSKEFSSGERPPCLEKETEINNHKILSKLSEAVRVPQCHIHTKIYIKTMSLIPYAMRKRRVAL